MQKSHTKTQAPQPRQPNNMKTSITSAGFPSKIIGKSTRRGYINLWTPAKSPNDKTKPNKNPSKPDTNASKQDVRMRVSVNTHSIQDSRPLPRLKTIQTQTPCNRNKKQSCRGSLISTKNNHVARSASQSGRRSRGSTTNPKPSWANNEQETNKARRQRTIKKPNIENKPLDPYTPLARLL